MRYFYPYAQDSLSAKKQFLKEHGYRAPHCFKNTWGMGYVLFDTKEDVNVWHKEHTGTYFYEEEPVPGQKFTKEDAFAEIRKAYEETINEVLFTRDFSLPLLAIGLPSSTTFGNRLCLQFVPAFDEKYLEQRFLVHYTPHCLKVSSLTNAEIKSMLIDLLFRYFYKDRFKKRIEFSQIN